MAGQPQAEEDEVLAGLVGEILPAYATEVVEDVFAVAAAEDGVVQARPHTIAVLGRKGSGKTAFSRALADRYGLVHIEVQTCVVEAMSRGTELGLQARQQLLGGGAVTPELGRTILLAKLASAEVQFRGYVLDGFPASPEDLAALKDECDHLPETIIHLRISNDDLRARRAGQLVDPVTGRVYSAAELAPPPHKHHRDSDAGGVGSAGGGSGGPRSGVDGVMGGSAGADDSGYFGDGGMSNGPVEAAGPDDDGYFGAADDAPLSYSDDYDEEPELTPEIRARLVSRPEDLASAIASEAQTYDETVAPVVASLVDELMATKPERVIDLPADQTPAAMSEAIETRLQALHIEPVVAPIVLDVDFGPTKSTDHKIELLLSWDLEEDAPWREMSKFGRLCPVTYAEEGKQVDGELEFAAAFRNKVYLFASPRLMWRFVRNPRPYLAHAPRPLDCRISVLGAPMSGKTTVSMRLVEAYGLTYINVEELVDEHIADGTDLGRRATTALRSGDILPAGVYADMIAIRLGLKADPRRPVAIKHQASSLMSPVMEGLAEVDEGDEFNNSATTGTGTSGDTGAAADSSGPGRRTASDHSYDSYSDAEEGYDDEDDGFDALDPGQDDSDWVRVPYLGWVLDGFPRTVEQAEALYEVGVVPSHVVLLDSDKNESLDIMLERSEKVRLSTQTGRLAAADAPNPKLNWPSEPRRIQLDVLDLTFGDGDGIPGLESETSDSLTAGGDGDGSVARSAATTDPGLGSALPSDASLPTVRVAGGVEAVSEASSSEPVGTDRMTDDYDDVSTVITAGESTVRDGEVDGDGNGEGGEGEGDGFEHGAKPRPIESRRIPSILNITPLPGLISFRVVSTMYETFHSQISHVMRYYNDLDVSSGIFPSHQTLPHVWGLVRRHVDPFVEVAEEADVELEEEDLLGGVYGNTKDYCPVTLKDHNCLFPGKEAYAVRYEGYVYLCAGEAEVRRFRANPAYYVGDSAAISVPPPRFVVVGAPGSGAEEIAATVGAKFDLPVVNVVERLRKMAEEGDDELSEDLKPYFEKPAFEGDDQTASASGTGTPGRGGERADGGPDDGETGSADDVSVANGGDADGADGGPGGAGSQAAQTDDDSIEEVKVDPEDFDPEILRRALDVVFSDPDVVERGFVLSSFPMSTEQMVLLVDGNRVPDAVFAVDLPEDEAVRRLFSMRKALKRAGFTPSEVAEVMKDPVWAESKGKTPRSARPVSARGIGGVGSDGFDTAREEELEMEMERRFDAEEAEIQRILLTHDQENGRALDVAGAWESLRVRTTVLDGARKASAVEHSVVSACSDLVENRKNLLETVTPLAIGVAEDDLATGRRLLSAFGRTCPVFYVENGYRNATPPDDTKPVSYRNRIYFLSSDEALEAFTKRPLDFATHRAPPRELPTERVRSHLFVIGPPKSGRTTLAQALAAKLRLEYLTLSAVLRSQVAGPVTTALGERIDAALRRGEELGDDDLVAAVVAVLGRHPYQASGWILDGFPLNANQAALLRAADVVPHLVFTLEVSDEVAAERCVADRALRSGPVHDSDAILLERLAVARVALPEIISAYDGTFMNVVSLSGDRSKWWLQAHALRVATDVMRRRQAYYVARRAHGAAPAMGLCLTDLGTNLGPFGNYCPVSFVLNNFLVDLGDSRESLKWLAAFDGAYYKCASKDALATFVADPERCLARPLPDILPRRLGETEAATVADRLALRGYCPVTFQRGPPGFDSIIPGDPSRFAAAYHGHFYAFASQECLDAFMRQPWEYVGLMLPSKLPPPRIDIDIRGLPLLGYLEQSTAEPVVQGLVAVGEARPVFPHLSASESALKYMAIYLKAHNTRHPDHVREKYLAKLGEFEEMCETITVLRAMNPLDGDGAPPAEDAEAAAHLARMVELFDAIPGLDLASFVR